MLWGQRSGGSGARIGRRGAGNLPSQLMLEVSLRIENPGLETPQQTPSIGLPVTDRSLPMHRVGRLESTEPRRSAVARSEPETQSLLRRRFTSQ